MAMHHHHHHHYASTHRHRHYATFHHHSSTSLNATTHPTTANRGKWLAISILTSSLIVAAAIAFIIVTFTVFPQQSRFPVFLYIPFTIVPALMIVIAIVSLVRAIRIYKKIPSQNEGEPKEEGEEDDRFDEE